MFEPAVSGSGRVTGHMKSVNGDRGRAMTGVDGHVKRSTLNSAVYPEFPDRAAEVSRGGCFCFSLGLHLFQWAPSSGSRGHRTKEMGANPQRCLHNYAHYDTKYINVF